MNYLGLVMLGFAPGIFWLWFINQRDRYIPVPAHLVVRTFLWGVAVSVPVIIVEFVLVQIANFQFGTDQKYKQVELVYASFLVAGITEELAKYLVVKKTVLDSPYFRQPLDGITFSAAAALGFASIENVGYVLSFGPAVILTRGPVSTLAHVLFSMTFGYALGARKLGKLWPQAPGLALIAAMTLHGLFDYLLLADLSYGRWAMAFFLALSFLFVPILRLAQRQSPYQGKVAAVEVTCASCAKQSGFGGTFCTACGSALAPAKARPFVACGQCHSTVESHHSFCTSCGNRLDRKLVSLNAQPQPPARS